MSNKASIVTITDKYGVITTVYTARNGYSITVVSMPDGSMTYWFYVEAEENSYTSECFHSVEEFAYRLVKMCGSSLFSTQNEGEYLMRMFNAIKL